MAHTLPKCPTCDGQGRVITIRDLEAQLASDPRDEQIRQQGEVIRILRDVLTEAEEYFDRYADADHNGDRYVPNNAMRQLTAIRAALTSAQKIQEGVA